jgi:uncharacterized protein YprB with RNaseH-like and TPR domain
MVTQQRIARLRDAVTRHAAVQPRSIRPQVDAAELPPIDVILRGDWHETVHGPVFVRDEWFPLEHRHGSMPLSIALDARIEALRHLLGSHPPDPSRLAFFDIETTGLSGGTGTWVILAGLGSYEEGAFRMRQYFLADLAHEHAMLSMLADDLGRFDGLVSYNGRSFDVPFIQSRMTLARLRNPAAAMPHFDLLHAIRRLFRHRMPTGCRLAEAERQLLRIDRTDDIPGSLIPSLYFDYVQTGRAAPLRGLFRHNAEDVLSLVGVLYSCARLLSSDDLDPDDAIAAARWWERTGDQLRAARLYGRALPWLEGGEDWAWVATRHARLCKRANLREEAVPLWSKLWDHRDRDAGLELAKHHEHRAKNHALALGITLELLQDASPPERNALERRAARLRRKLERRSGTANGVSLE